MTHALRSSSVHPLHGTSLRTAIRRCGFGVLAGSLLMCASACDSDKSTASHDDAASLADASTSSDDASSEAVDASTESADTCTRTTLSETIDQYYAALAAHEPSQLHTAPSVKYTENGETVELGEGLWKTAGALKFKRSILDTMTCSSASESVVVDGDTDRVMGLRLKTEAGAITEIESIIVHPGDYLIDPNPAALIASESDDWETVLPPEQRASREQLTEIVDRYFKLFPNGACNFSPSCQRLENGFLPPGFDCDDLLSCDMDTDLSTVLGGMTPRAHVIDVETNVAVGFTMFGGTYSDFHMFKFRDGEVVGVHAVLAAADGSGWD